MAEIDAALIKKEAEPKKEDKPAKKPKDEKPKDEEPKDAVREDEYTPGKEPKELNKMMSTDEYFGKRW